MRYGQFRITVEREGSRLWYRLHLGRSVVADRLWTLAELERALAAYGLTVDQFEDGPDGDG